MGEQNQSCRYCGDSGTVWEDGKIQRCGCECGCEHRGYDSEYSCGKMLSGKVCVAIWRRPTVLHYISRVYLMCDACSRRMFKRGLPDFTRTKAPEGLMCGSRVKLLGRGTKPDFISPSAPDYMPIEDPRTCGLRTIADQAEMWSMCRRSGGGPLVQNWNTARKAEQS